MKNFKLLGLGLVALASIGTLTGCGSSEYDSKGRLILNLKNVYFDQWTGEDRYTEILNDKFGVKIKASSYDYNEWDGMVYTAVNGDNLPDAFHFNLKAYNYGSTYESWVKKQMLKPLPKDLSRWKNLSKMLSNVSNVEELKKIDGNLYCIPIMNDINNVKKDFSNFTYVYRRDLVKAIDEKNKNKAGYEPLYREGDVYTWDEFERMVDALSKNPIDTQKAVIADQGWAFPSITNFYKDAPHCFGKDENGKAINNFTSENYIEGLERSKYYVDKLYYSPDQFNYTPEDNRANESYLGGQSVILYDNFSLSNYSKFRKAFKKNQETVDLDDGTAFLKIKDKDGKFALEGTENWFSATFFSYATSDQKMEKILDIIDYLLSEEGTRFAVYGEEGYDYNIVDGEIVLSSRGWERSIDTGEYPPKTMGGKYLRYMATLGNDTQSYDPFTNLDDYNILTSWMNEMKQAKEDGLLRVVQEPTDISWMSTPTKNDKTNSLLNDANVSAAKYCFGKSSMDKYLSELDTNNWKTVLAEINEKLGK